MRILLIDSYDSFTWNLVQGFAMMGAVVEVRYNDEVSPDDFRLVQPDLVVLSPGPGRPEDAGAMPTMLAAAIEQGFPLFGVCLGHQAICAHFGVPTIHAQAPIHGKASPVLHDGSGIFRGIPSPMLCARYHSLCADAAAIDPAGALVVTGRLKDGTVMAVEHRSRPIWGVQFHPESFVTPDGPRLLGNVMQMARSAVSAT